MFAKYLIIMSKFKNIVNMKKRNMDQKIYTIHHSHFDYETS